MLKLFDEEFKPCGYYTKSMHENGESLTQTHIEQLSSTKIGDDKYRINEFRQPFDLTFIYQDQVVWAKICAKQDSMFQMMFSGFGSGECSFEELLAMDARIHRYS
ncbi:hypothetical protein [Laspinema olomoucense]|uniref:hypothetical protein n=1 Tax=Laspinema olomoucense TaxID=3231600 RepID=UPI0021BACDB5|nr:hypothetical protein [Laspinema sp. D3c]MCT7992495.1 hypothetical protein [Laspinema sp. D3c]